MELAWAAGFFDGEGCVTLSRSRAGDPQRLQMSVAQVDERPLRRFGEAIGGYGRFALRKKMPRNGIRLPMVLSIHRQDDIRRVLEVLWPHLSEPKREQVARCYWAIVEALGTRKHLPRDVVIRTPGNAGNRANREKTHCPKGHPYDARNTYWFAQRTGTLGRACRACRRESVRRSNALRHPASEVG